MPCIKEGVCSCFFDMVSSNLGYCECILIYPYYNYNMLTQFDLG